MSNREGKMGRLDFDGFCPIVPNAIARLSTNLEPCNYNLSGMGPEKTSMAKFMMTTWEKTMELLVL